MSKEMLSTPDNHTLAGDIRHLTEILHHNRLARIGIGVLALGATVGIMTLQEHRETAINASITAKRLEQEALATARAEAIDTLALADPTATSLQVVAEFTVPEGSNISTEAFEELSGFIQRVETAGNELPEGLRDENSDTLRETILESGRAHEANDFTQPGETFIISEVELTTNGSEETIYVIQKP